MANERKSILLRLPPDLWEQLNRWARDDLRSLNAQIEYLLREAARKRAGNGTEKSARNPDDRPPESGE